jgi:fructose-1,6-bisphosphatase/inositol monophosphatase family enzyme
MTTVDLDRVAQALAEVAEQEIMPRWRNLAAGDVREKTGPNDLVTVADEAAEHALAARLPDLLPGSIMIGEESVEKDRGLLDVLKGDQPVWIVDPVDGTKNFAEGSDRFGVMVALVERDVTIAAVIYEPVTGRALMAEAGGGAELVDRSGERTRLNVTDTTGLDAMQGSFNFRFIPDETVRKAVRAKADAILTDRHYRRGCAAYDYRMLVTGEWDFAFYWKNMPWDHAPGLLIHQEAGGYSARFDGSPYRASELAGGILATPDAASWRDFRSAVLAPIG